MPIYAPALVVEEEDGSPSVSGVTKIQVTNGKLTADGGGTVSIDASGSGGAAGNLASGKVTRTNIGANLTIASTTWADMDSTNLTMDLTTGAHRCMIVLSGRLSNSGTGLTRFGFTVDGTAVLTEAAGSNGVTVVRCDSAGVSTGFMVTYVTDALSAATHTFRPRWNCSASTTTAHQTASSDFITFTVHELYAA